MNAASVATIAPSTKVGLGHLTAMAQRVLEMQNDVRASVLAPDQVKQLPFFTQTELASLLGKDIQWMAHRLRVGDEPAPKMVDRKPRFTLQEAQVWTRRHRKAFMRPEGQKGIVVATGNFKGGSTKTTTDVTGAQGLSILGHKTLLVDLDPQGSATYLCGVIPELDDVQTLLPVLEGSLDTVEPLIRKTYWPGMDLIAAAPIMSLAEGGLLEHPSGRFWEVLRNALEPVLHLYDVVLIDTGPTLSPLTGTGFMAADGLLMPLTPNALDFASSGQFWTLFADMQATYQHSGMAEKEYEFVKIMLSRVDYSDTATEWVSRMVKRAYGPNLMEAEIPKTTVTTRSSTTFATVFDMQVNRASREAYTRAKDKYFQFVFELEQSICGAWARRVKDGE